MVVASLRVARSILGVDHDHHTTIDDKQPSFDYRLAPATQTIAYRKNPMSFQRQEAVVRGASPAGVHYCCTRRGNYMHLT